MSRRYPEIDEMRDARHRTLDLVAGLSEAQAAFVPESGGWSIAEVLDHLVRSDDMFFREIETLLARGDRGAFVCRGLKILGGRLAALPSPVRLGMELPLFFWNLTIPGVVRRFALEHPIPPAKAPPQLRPRRGRSLDLLRKDLTNGLGELDRLRHDHRDVDLRSYHYYGPVVGLTTLPGLIRLQAAHERRHQGQLRNIKSEGVFPRTVETEE